MHARTHTRTHMHARTQGSTGLDAGGNVTDSKAREEAWLTSFDSCVPDYERITSQLLVGMFIVMYAKPDSRRVVLVAGRLRGLVSPHTLRPVSTVFA